MATQQTILGSTGAIGTLLAKELPAYTDQLRLVSRKPEKVNESDALVEADLTDAAQTEQAVAGSAVVYLTAGLPYELKAWRRDWPQIMDNVIAACRHAEAKLVFFDNVYMYDAASLDPMTESHPLNPPSEKGKVRLQIATRLIDAMRKGEVDALIARSADFYGPLAEEKSMIGPTVFKPLSRGGKATWLCRADAKHSFTYTSDAARATALLGNSSDAFGQAWHLPTAANPMTGDQWVHAVAQAYGVAPRYRVAGRLILRAMGLFNPLMRELVEMLYQYDRDYVFNSDKFQSRFELQPTPYDKGIDDWKSAFAS